MDPNSENLADTKEDPEFLFVISRVHYLTTVRRIVLYVVCSPIESDESNTVNGSPLNLSERKRPGMHYFLAVDFEDKDKFVGKAMGGILNRVAEPKIFGS